MPVLRYNAICSAKGKKMAWASARLADIRLPPGRRTRNVIVRFGCHCTVCMLTLDRNKLLFGIIALAPHTHRDIRQFSDDDNLYGPKYRRNMFSRNKETICSAWTRLCCLYDDKWLPTSRHSSFERFFHMLQLAPIIMSVYISYILGPSLCPLRIRIIRYASAVIVSQCAHKPKSNNYA